jgi:hypothetical protein
MPRKPKRIEAGDTLGIVSPSSLNSGMLVVPAGMYSGTSMGALLSALQAAHVCTAFYMVITSFHGRELVVRTAEN